MKSSEHPRAIVEGRYKTKNFFSNHFLRFVILKIDYFVMKKHHTRIQNRIEFMRDRFTVVFVIYTRALTNES